MAGITLAYAVIGFVVAFGVEWYSTYGRDGRGNLIDNPELADSERVQSRAIATRDEEAPNPNGSVHPSEVRKTE